MFGKLNSCATSQFSSNLSVNYKTVPPAGITLQAHFHKKHSGTNRPRSIFLLSDTEFSLCRSGRSGRRRSMGRGMGATCQRVRSNRVSPFSGRLHSRRLRKLGHGHWAARIFGAACGIEEWIRHAENDIRILAWANKAVDNSVSARRALICV